MSGLDGFLLDPGGAEGRCASGRHVVRPVDHAKPLQLPDGGPLVHVCVLCWHAAELDLMRACGLPEWRVAKQADRRRLWRSNMIIDQVAVERVAAGEDYRILTARERQATVRALTARGFSCKQISDRTGMHPRQVVRFRNGPLIGSASKAWERLLLRHLVDRATADRPTALAAA